MNSLIFLKLPLVTLTIEYQFKDIYLRVSLDIFLEFPKQEQYLQSHLSGNLLLNYS